MASWSLALRSTVALCALLVGNTLGIHLATSPLGGLAHQDAKFDLNMPSTAVFTEHGSPLVDVQVGSGVSSPEEGKDMSLVMVVDADNHLHIHNAAEEIPHSVGQTRVPLAWATYKNTVAKNGWGYLSVKGTADNRFSDELKSYAVGFLEGFATTKQIKEFQHNAHALMMKDEQNHQAIGNVRDLFDKELHNIFTMTGMLANSTSATLAQAGVISRGGGLAQLPTFWKHAKFMTLQAWGVMDAYNQNVDKVHGTPMSMVDMLILNSDGETPELEKAYDFQEVLLRQANREGGDDNMTDEAFLQKGRDTQRQSKGHSAHLRNQQAANKLHRRGHGHHFRGKKHGAAKTIDDRAWRKFKARYGRCSALVRLAKDNKDIFVGHTTFSDYSEMNRIFKYYDLPLEGGASQKMGFSSYPGVIGSTDDYYLMDTGIVVTETTVSMMSDEAFDNLDDNGTYVPDYMRIMVSNRLARSASEWVDYMKASATGTYNSQWMVLDYNLFKPGKPLTNGTFFVLEQAPGVSHAEDMSMRLQRVGYWASENRGFFNDIRNISGESEAEEINGNVFSESQNPRAHIFQKTAPTVQSLADMRVEMQRNKWPDDVDGGPANSPDHAIAARRDLAKDDPDPNGGVDSKVTNACLAKMLAADAISGPSHDDQKPFRWTDTNGKPLYPDYPRDGLPDVWNFDWVRFTLDGELAGLPKDDCSIKM